MKLLFELIVAASLGLSATANAFTPINTRKVSSPAAATSPLFRRSPALLSTTGGGSTTSSDDEPLFGNDVLTIDTEEAKKDIARNWGFILLAGTISVAAGSWALALPFFATEVAQVSTVFTLLGVGLMNVIGSFYVEKGYKLQSFLLGACQMAVGAMLESKPAEGIVAMTLAIAGTVFAEGLYRVLLAAQNRKMEGFWGVLLSGFASIIGSAYVVKFLPLTAVYVPGVALGCGLLSVGISRIFVSLAGRERANEQIA